ncbi:MAG: T9SS type A sorting domain-containing protein [Saprospiraceae bacterium]
MSSSNPPCVRDIRTRFRATDNCNNATTGISQRSPAPGRDLRIVFSIQDTEAPTFSALPNPSLLTSNGALCGVGVQGITTGPVAPNTPFTVAGLPFATPNNTQFDDNCSSDANIILDLLTIVETNPGDDCSNQITLTWRVTDECGKLSTAAQVYTFANDAAPTITPVAAPDFVDCGDSNLPGSGNVAVPTAMDNCGNLILNVIFANVNPAVPGLYYGDATPTPCVQNPLNGNLNGESTFQRAWTAVDNCGNVSATYFQLITITDTQAPNFSCPGNWNISTALGGDCPSTANVSLSESQVNPIMQGTPFTVAGQSFFAPSGITDDCGNVSLYVWNIAQTIDPCNSEFTITWRAVDDCGNYTECDQTFFVFDNTPPSMATLPGAVDQDISLTDPNGPCPGDFVGVNYDLNTMELYIEFMSGDIIGPYPMPTAVDDCSTVTVLPNVSQFPNNNCDFDLIIAYDYWDECFNFTVTPYIQTLSIHNDAKPEFLPGLDTDDVVYGCPNSAVPSDFFIIADQLYFNSVNGVQTVDCPKPGDWIEACGDGTLQLVSVVKDAGPVNLCNASFTLTWQVNNGCGESSDPFISKVDVNDNTAPSFSSFAADVQVTCYPDLLAYTNQLAFADNCSGNMVNLFITESTNGGAGCVSDPEIITRTYTIEDECGNSYAQDQIITLIDDEAPVFTNAPQNAFYTCIDDVPLANPANATAQSGANCSDIATVTVTDVFLGGAGCPGDPIDIHREFTATDACGNQTVYTQEITVVDNIAPDASACANLDDTFECAGPAANEAAADAWDAANITALENCATDNCASSVTVTSDYDYNNFSVTCGSAGSITVTYTITDDCGNFTTQSATFTIEDTTNPSWTTPPANMTVECDGLGNSSQFGTWINSFGGAAASDDCGTVVIAPLPDSVSTNNCGGEITYYVTFFAIDECNNSISQQATFTIEDTTAPAIWHQAQDYDAECDMNNQGGSSLQVWLDLHGGASAHDDCSGVTWTYNLIGQVPGCGNTGGYIYEFTATDGCGNSATTSATFSYVDTQDPILVTPASNDQVDCGPNGFQPALNAWIANNGGMVAQDMCGSVTYTNSLLSSTSGCGNTGTYTYEFTATDECGMSVSSSATFTVVDTQGPVLSGVPASTSQSCELPLPAVPNVTADDCDTNPITVTYSQTITPVNANTTVETVTRTWTAQDNCGNVTTESQTITIFDNVHPVILNCPTGIGPVNTNGATCATVTWPQVGVADNCTVTSFTSNIQPGTCLPVGIHTVTYSATDAGGNGSSCSFDVEVVDNQSYCPVPDNGAMFYIHRFVFNGVTNTSGNNGGYADFSAISSTANAGGDLVMTFIPGSASGFNFPAYWSVFVDFNEDGDYTDAGELIFQRRGNGPFIWRVMLPGNIPAGAYSMRVYMHRYHFPQPCDDHQGLGEAEDYTLNIVPSPTRVAPTNELMEEQTRDLEVFAFENNLELEEMDAQSVSPDVNLYPNPTANWLYIDLADYSSENGEVSIFDSKGMTVMRIPFNANESQTLEINVASLPTGMYYARIMNGQKAITKNFAIDKLRP